MSNGTPPNPAAPAAAVSLSALERMTAVALWLHLFLLITTLVIGRSMGSAVFLHRFDGRGLSAIYVFVGLAVAFLISGIEWLGRESSTLRVTFYTLAVAYLVTLGAAAIVPMLGVSGHRWFYGALYVGLESFAFIATIQFWAMANGALHPQQAHRLYVFIATGGIMGSIAGGAITDTFIHGAPVIALWWIAFLAPCQCATLLLFSRLAKRMHQDCPKDAHRWNLDTTAHAFGLRLRPTETGPPVHDESIRSNRQLTHAFGLVSLLMVFSTTLVDYYYKVSADVTYAGDVTHLNSFFGRFYICVGLATLLSQLLLTPLVLHRGSAFIGLWASPTALAVLAILNLVAPGIWMSAAFKLTDSVATHSVYRSCQEMLFTPLPTVWVRRLKSLSDGVFGRYGLLLAGCFLFAVSGIVEQAGSAWLLPWTLVALACWALAVNRLKREFCRQGQTRLGHGAMPRSATSAAMHADGLRDAG